MFNYLSIYQSINQSIYLSNYFNSVSILFLKATDKTKRRKGTITVNLKKEWSEKGGNIPHERFTYMKFPGRNTHVGHLIGDVSKNIIQVPC